MLKIQYNRFLPFITIPLIMVFLISSGIPNYADSYRVRKTYYGKTFYKWAGGYAGKQDKKGSIFPTGGGFFWVDQGGPTANVTVSLGAGYGYGTASITLGICSSKGASGKFVTVPSRKHAYKLYIKRKLKLRKYKIYVYKWSPVRKKYCWVMTGKNVKNFGAIQTKQYAKRVD